MAATLDQVSGGRLLLGLGAGSQPNEHLAYGIDLLDPPSRVSRFEEALAVITSLLRDEEPTFDGDYYTLAAGRCEPGTLQTPLPLLVAGGGERRSIPLAARFADAWHAWTTPDEFGHKCEVLDAACAATGREPAEIARLTGQVLLVVPRTPTADDDPVIIGTAPFVSERLATYQGVGVDEFVVRDHAHTPIAGAIESLAALGDEVLPQLAAR